MQKNDRRSSRILTGNAAHFKLLPLYCEEKFFTWKTQVEEPAVKRARSQRPEEQLASQREISLWLCACRPSYLSRTNTSCEGVESFKPSSYPPEVIFPLTK